MKSLRTEIQRMLAHGRTQIDRMARDVRLLRDDLRERKDDVLNDLESAYARMQRRFHDLGDRTQRVAKAARDSAREAYDSFREKLAECEAKEPSAR